VGLLQYQGRMHPDIAAFPNAFFYRQEQLQPVPCPHQLETGLDYGEPSEDALDDQLKRHRVLFLPAADEASVVVDVLRRLYRQIGSERFDAARSIGIIVTYRHQIALIRRELAQLGLPQLEEITIDTVERYQGSQRDVIIYSTGVQDQDGLDFLTSNCFEEDGHTIDRKLNVAMTRARKQLIITGQEALLCKNAIFSELIAHYSI
jgi:superfamily I DNA and/or RNA helicase